MTITMYQCPWMFINVHDPKCAWNPDPTSLNAIKNHTHRLFHCCHAHTSEYRTYMLTFFPIWRPVKSESESKGGWRSKEHGHGWVYGLPFLKMVVTFIPKSSIFESSTPTAEKKSNLHASVCIDLSYRLPSKIPTGTKGWNGQRWSPAECRWTCSERNGKK